MNRFESICLDWVHNNPVGRGVGWHPYTTSKRIVNWCRAGISSAALLDSLYEQAAYLYRNLETYLEGNHLLENARALVFAGNFFGGGGESGRWLNRGIRLFQRELTTQVLADGGHYERSPMYHAIVLEGCVDVLNLVDPDDPSWRAIVEIANRMVDFQVSLTHPNGRIGLFNDSTEEIAVPTSALVEYATQVTGRSAQSRTALPDSGYYVLRHDELHAIVDAGAVGPDHLPGHAHADILSFELSLSEKLFVVDTGVFEYEAGPLRALVRSTAAHNTVSVDGRDQVECWGSFRVARRYSPADVRFEETTTEIGLAAEFRGYAKLIGDSIIHARRITVDKEVRRLTVSDTISGTGRHAVVSRIHLHPEVATARRGDSYELRVGGTRALLTISEGEHTIETSPYFPEFGKRVDRPVVEIGGTVDLPVQLEYSIEY